MTGLELLLLVIMGAFVGLAGGYAGIGGAPFLVAGLVLLLDYTQHDAQGTVLAVMLAPMSLPGVLVMRDRARLLLPEITIGVLAYALCSNVGARIAFSMETAWLQASFGLLLTGLGVRYLLRKSGPPPIEPNPTGPTVGEGALPFSRRNVTLISAAIGIVGGLFGIGAGVLMVPLFIGLFHLHKDDARALSLSILLPPVSVGAVLEYEQHGAIDWWVSGIIFALYFLTNHYGARLGRAHSTPTFLTIMGLLLGFLGVVILGTSLPDLLG